MTVKRLLLVEDTADEEALALRALRSAGLEVDVTVVRDGAEALEYLLGSEDGAVAPAPLPDAVLLDLSLPKRDGFEILERLRAHERTRYLPVVIFSSSARESDRENGYRLGANSYVQKPIDYEALAETVRTIGRYWLQYNLPALGGNPA